MKIKDTLILWNNEKNSLLLIDTNDPKSDSLYSNMDNKVGSCFTEWRYNPGFPRLVVVFVEIMQAMLQNKDITIEKAMHEICKVDELSCCFADDVYKDIGLPIPTFDQYLEYEKLLKQELTREGLKMTLTKKLACSEC